MNNRQIILRCADVSSRYMRLPAGSVSGLKKLPELYKRMAIQSLVCAHAWVEDIPCPNHEPAVDAFWWGIVAWADAFGSSVGVDQTEWGRVFVSPHDEFASYLRPNGLPEPLPEVSGPPADVIIRLDTLWMERVIQLTSKWGLLAHLKDKGALAEAQNLGADLRNPGSPAYKAYLESDLEFFRKLFVNFPFSQGVRKQLDDFIAKAEESI
ncbi:hypothetical protein ES703_30629 [subsurface metagenome]